MSEDLTALRAEFPAFRIWREDACGRVRFVARSLRADVNPHTVITADLDELQAAIALSRVAPVRPFSPVTPNVARMYDYLLRGKDHLAVDRAAATRITRRFPEVAAIARANREFQARAVCYAAVRGITQFIDLGAGLPAAPNTHDSAREITPDARVVYVDHDPVVLAHARARLAVDSEIAIVAADIRDPTAVLADPALTSVIDLTEPVCVLLVSVLHFLPAADADAAVAAFRNRMAPGSYLVISAGTCTGTDPALIQSLQAAYGAATPVTGRAETDIAAWFAGLALARPGLTDVREWRPDRHHLVDRAGPSRARFLAGIAHKPASAHDHDHGTSRPGREGARP